MGCTTSLLIRLCIMCWHYACYTGRVPCWKPFRWQSVEFSVSQVVLDTSPAHPESLWPAAGEAPLYQMNTGKHYVVGSTLAHRDFNLISCTVLLIYIPHFTNSITVMSSVFLCLSNQGNYWLWDIHKQIVHSSTSTNLQDWSCTWMVDYCLRIASCRQTQFILKVRARRASEECNITWSYFDVTRGFIE